MDFGIVMFTGYSISPAALGRAVEERGFDSLFYPEHTHIPVRSRRTDGTSTAGYAHTYDPLVALGAVAAVTERIKLGTGVCLVPQRDPIGTAKAVATLDHMSGGRVLFGVGAGWNREELANHGTDPRTRMAVLADRVRAMRTIWAQDEAEYHGEYVDFDPIWSWPKPARHPGPPVLVGGNGPGTEDRVLDFGDEWLPQCGHLADVDELRTRIANLRDRAGTAVPVTLFGALPTMLDEFVAAGVDRCLFVVRGETEADVLSTLDELAGVAHR
ncbi:MAG TPA: LLM class F420-dependent oxidoreductase [Pseudonocardiaceae bacterium]|nr:LLM class F420-dependent oxidoreductase [Pseudonocardiaceae bacterium]